MRIWLTVTYKRIAAVDVRIPVHFSDEAKDLVRSLLKYTPSERLPLNRVLRHPWISRYDPGAYARACKFIGRNIN